LIGNEVLQCVAKGLSEACRGSDYLARMGGDEFVIVLPGLQGDYSSHLERLREVAVGAGQTICGEPCLSMSVGLAIYPFDGSDAEALIAEADRRMYRLKHQSKSERELNSALYEGPEQEGSLGGLVRVLRDAERPGLSEPNRV
jgi:diguanylate cyclase (GGDEF)-like protein